MHSGEIPEEVGAPAFDDPEIGERDREARVWIDLTRIRPAELAARLGAGRPLELAAPEELDEKVKAARWDASHLVKGHGSKRADPVAGLLEELPPGGVVEALVPVDAASRQEPRAFERSRGLFDDQDPSRVVDTADDRAHSWALSRQGALPLGSWATGYGFLVGVGPGVRVGGTSERVGVGSGVAVRVGTGVNVGVGVGVGHGSGLARFQVNRP